MFDVVKEHVDFQQQVFHRCARYKRDCNKIVNIIILINSSRGGGRRQTTGTSKKGEDVLRKECGERELSCSLHSSHNSVPFTAAGGDEWHQ